MPLSVVAALAKELVAAQARIAELEASKESKNDGWRGKPGTE